MDDTSGDDLPDKHKINRYKILFGIINLHSKYTLIIIIINFKKILKK